jgi:hypothetical protein
MKNFLILALSFWVWYLWREKQKATTATAATTTALQGDFAGPLSGAGPGAPAQATEPTPQGPAPVLNSYGNYSDPGGVQNLTVEISPTEGEAYSAADSVKLQNSAMYPLYYKITGIQTAPSGNTALTLNTLFIGAESEVYIIHQGAYVSGFSGAVRTFNSHHKSAFLR